MPKALELSDDSLTAPPVPKAAQAATIQPVEFTAPRGKGRAKETPRKPLQVRWPRDEVKAAQLAAIQLDFPTVSEFMLACFHAYMKNKKQSA